MFFLCLLPGFSIGNAFEFQSMPLLPSSDIQKIQLKFHKRLETKPDSIFYNLVSVQEGFLAFYRASYCGYELGTALYNKSLLFIEDLSVCVNGEDPRLFQHKDYWYLT